MAENGMQLRVYEELLFRLDRGLLGAPCASWLREHVDNSRAQLEAARAVLKRAVELTDAARRLQVGHAVAADAELLHSLIEMQQRVSLCMQAVMPSSAPVTKQEQHEAAIGGYATDSSTESESERPTSPSLKRKRQALISSASESIVKSESSVYTPVPSIDVVDLTAEAESAPKPRGPNAPKPKASVSHLSLRSPPIAPVKGHLMRLAQVRDGSATLRHIQSLMSWTSWPPFGASCEEEWAWVRSLAKQIVAVGSVVENLPREKRLPRVEGVLVVATITSAVAVIVPAATDIMLPMNARELIALMKGLQQILIAFPRYNVNVITKNVKNLLEFLKFRHHGVAREWNSKCNLRVKYRKQLSHYLATLDEWDGTGLCRAAAMDQLMEQFDNVIKASSSMWDLSSDEIVLDCIKMMEKLLDTFKAGTKKQGERLVQVDAWKNSIKISEAKSKKTAPGSMFMPVLESAEKAALVSVGAALLGSTHSVVSTSVASAADVILTDQKPTRIAPAKYAKEAKLARACVLPAQKQAEHLAKNMSVSQGHNVNIQLRAIKAAAKIPDEHLASRVAMTSVLEPLHNAFVITVDLFSKQQPWTTKAANLGSMLLQAVNKSGSERPAFKRLFNEQRMKLQDVLKRRARGKG